MVKVHEFVDKVRAKIKANALNEQNPNGILTSDLNDYLQCLEMNHRDLKQLLRKDEVKWAQNLENKKRDANHA